MRQTHSGSATFAKQNSIEYLRWKQKILVQISKIDQFFSNLNRTRAPSYLKYIVLNSGLLTLPSDEFGWQKRSLSGSFNRNLAEDFPEEIIFNVSP